MLASVGNSNLMDPVDFSDGMGDEGGAALEGDEGDEDDEDDEEETGVKDAGDSAGIKGANEVKGIEGSKPWFS